jgi:hypothetical protein
MDTILRSEEVRRLAKLVEEATRSKEVDTKRFVEPGKDDLPRAKLRHHHIIFGRRGSGKTSLLSRAAADLSLEMHPIAYVNLETFKELSYPDVLLSVLIESFRKFIEWFESREAYSSHKYSVLEKLFRRKPQYPVVILQEQIDQLENLLNSPDSAEMSRTIRQDQELINQIEKGGQIGHYGIELSGKHSETEKTITSEEITEAFRHSKTVFLNRHIAKYQRIFRKISEISERDSYLFLDDLYQIRKEDQAKVLGYFHTIAKGNNLWLKVGTIRHRTREYIPGNPSRGVKIGEDVGQIDLDKTLDKYRETKKFLVKVLDKFREESGLESLKLILTDGAINRLVVASGGVARDFLRVFKDSIDFALERIPGSRTERISAEDVNKASGEYDSNKKDEFERDTSINDRSTLEGQFYRIFDFCINHRNTNVFLLDMNTPQRELDLIEELVDLKLIHLVKSRVTVSNRPGKIFKACMLDLSQYTGVRQKYKMKIIEFWRKGESQKLRRSSLIYDPSG